MNKFAGALGSQLKCILAIGPTTLLVIPEAIVLLGGKPMAHMNQNKPLLNILPAVPPKCNLLPVKPCIPMTSIPFLPFCIGISVGSITNFAINASANLICVSGGVLQNFCMSGWELTIQVG